MMPKSDWKWCETTPIRPIIASHISLHPFRVTTFIISHYGSTQGIILALVYCINSSHSPLSIFLPYTTKRPLQRRQHERPYHAMWKMANLTPRAFSLIRSGCTIYVVCTSSLWIFWVGLKHSSELSLVTTHIPIPPVASVCHMWLSSCKCLLT